MQAPLPAAAKRRKPTQSRARATAQAIEQAFVQLLVEKGYAQVAIRQVLALAGVGAGSFYEYFASKEALAAVCIRQRVRAIAEALAVAVRDAATLPLPERVDALLDTQLRAPLAEPEQWAALFHLERQVSRPQAFRELYREFVALWETGLGAGPDWPEAAALADAAFAAHAIAYSLVSQTLMARSEHPDAVALRALVRQAVHGYLSVVAPRAYRGCLDF
ncbi:TetR/AcrR family transcriptional regulator [Pseudoduganella violaceinigra]|uniref:TetR/AcrR family transcriptional regulator n=1 Tax=Pseudoduganella violaceinigra TaxID=246602 RepID=UPI0006870A90|nr:TetR/AcrR family transcriptional regulator [Pseudoduganella violaceinigra]